MIEIRDATTNDKDFLWNLKVASMRKYIEVVYGWNDAEQYCFFEKAFFPEALQIIQADGQDAGMFELQERGDDWLLARIEVLPSFQGKGLGTFVIQRLIKSIQETMKPFRLQVFKGNPALRLYQRLGFIKTGETETHIQMELPIISCTPITTK